MAGKLMETLSWLEVEEEIKKNPYLVVPLGSKQKEHGLHLPLNTDFILAEYFRDRILQQFNVLATSTIDINYYPAFTEYPGTEHLTLHTAIDLVYQKCKCHVNHGVTHVYILNMGMSTNAVLEKVKEKFDVEKIKFRFTNLAQFDNSQIIKKLEQQQCGTHADELETSMMLYIKPEAVNMRKAKKADNLEMLPGPLTRNPNAKAGVYSPTGAWGNPLLANAEKGEIIVNEYIRLLFKDMDELLSE